MQRGQVSQVLLRVSEAAELLAVKESTIRAWLLARRLSSVRVGKRAVRIPASEVERIIAEGFVPALAEGQSEAVERITMRIVHIGAAEGKALPESKIIYEAGCTVEIHHTTA